MNKSIASVLVFGLVTSCGQKPADPEQAAIELRDRLKPCIQDQAAQRAVLIEAVQAGALDARYAEQAKELAVACRSVRETLERANPTSTCIQIAQGFEMFGWELNAALEGRQPFTAATSALSYLDDQLNSCLSELPPPPPETPEQRAARERAEAESDAALAAADAASLAAADAAAEASAAQADLAQAMRRN